MGTPGGEDEVESATVHKLAERGDEVRGLAGQPAVAEGVDQQDRGVEAAVARRGVRQLELDDVVHGELRADALERRAAGEVRTNRREDVAPVGVRAKKEQRRVLPIIHAEQMSVAEPLERDPSILDLLDGCTIVAALGGTPRAPMEDLFGSGPVGLRRLAQVELRRHRHLR
jgi:hypothetical protein